MFSAEQINKAILAEVSCCKESSRHFLLKNILTQLWLAKLSARKQYPYY